MQLLVCRSVPRCPFFKFYPPLCAGQHITRHKIIMPKTTLAGKLHLKIDPKAILLFFMTGGYKSNLAFFFIFCEVCNNITILSLQYVMPVSATISSSNQNNYLDILLFFQFSVFIFSKSTPFRTTNCSFRSLRKLTSDQEGDSFCWSKSSNFGLF